MTMTPVEYLPLCGELRSYFLFFHDRRDCTGITWLVDSGDVVSAGQRIAELTFATLGAVDIAAPVDGRVIRTYSPDVAELPHRPSLPLVLFQPVGAPVPKGDGNPWEDVRDA